MRLALAVAALLVAAAPAHADRAAVWSLGVSLDERATGATYAATGRAHTSALGGARLSLAFEDHPARMPPRGAFAAELRLVPELVAGVVADAAHAEGYAGAGVRVELDIASHPDCGYRQRTAFYAAARALAIGAHQGGAAELVVGGWVGSGRDRHRFGWEGGAQIRPRADDQPDRRELDAVLSIYTSWR